ncbi:MAG TPA: DUF4337 domain-containing protein [Burkholderiales bacterium]|nr:DUF4337 domain-containing protein [Burkholderiales bacterium]
MSHDHGHIEGSNKNIALLIAALAALLALSETLGKSAQTAALSLHIEASNLWAFFQAKTIRMTTVRTAAEALEVNAAVAGSPAKEAVEKRLAAWRTTAARYESEPETREGRKELMERARETEKKRDYKLAAYHHLELSSAAFQLAIVLASAAVVTGVMVLAWIGGGLGAIGVVLAVIGIFAPTAVHFF